MDPNMTTPDFIRNGDERRLSAAESLPVELLRYSLAIQYGHQLHWSAMRALIRNNLVSRRFGTWVLTTTGLSAAGIARQGVASGEISMQGVGLAAGRRSEPQGFLDPTDEQNSGDFERGIESQFSSPAAQAIHFTPEQSVQALDDLKRRQTDDLKRRQIIGSGSDSQDAERILKEQEWASRTIGTDTGRFFGVGDSDMDDSFMRRPPAIHEEDPPIEEQDSSTIDNRLAQIPGLTRGSLAQPSDSDGNLEMNFSVGLGANGWRWTTISSTGYRDTDGELITRSALSQDVARADGDGDYGPLVWWHEYEPLLVHEGTGQHLLYEALVLGHCDFNAMAGPESQFLLESGTFINEEVAMAIAENAHKLAVSIKFTYDDRDLDDDGIYHAIRRRERSLLPRGREANLFTGILAGQVNR